MKIKTAELTGAALDWAVAKAKQPVYSDTSLIEAGRGGYDGIGNFHEPFTPSTDWEQGGPIIERERITLDYFPDGGEWLAQVWDNNGNPIVEEQGPTPLIAAMRCYVANKIGDEVAIPEELLK